MKINKLNKKGAEMTIGTIVMIILALVVLVVIIYGFTTGWGNLWDKVVNIGGGKINVQTVVQSCQIACTTNSQYDYCSKQRNIIIDESGKADESLKFCSDLEADPIYGLDECTNFNCDSGGDRTEDPGVLDPTDPANGDGLDPANEMS
jgi:hypothetical protein